MQRFSFALCLIVAASGLRAGSLYTMDSGGSLQAAAGSSSWTVDPATVSSIRAFGGNDGSAGSSFGLFTFQPSGLGLSMNQSRGGTFGYQAATNMVVNFTPAQDLLYTLSGEYSATTPYVLFQVILTGSGFEQNLFNSLDLIDNRQTTLPQDYILGSSRARLGSLTGTLKAGHHYTLQCTAEIKASPGADSGGSASGSLSLAMAPALSAVPEPNSSMSCVTLSAVLLARRVRPAGQNRRQRGKLLSL